jgi:hypothetical protein
MVSGGAAGYSRGFAGASFGASGSENVTVEQSANGIVELGAAVVGVALPVEVWADELLQPLRAAPRAPAERTQAAAVRQEKVIEE